jgi:hydrogenase maturation protease
MQTLRMARESLADFVESLAAWGLVDAVRRGGPAGAIHVMEHDELVGLHDAHGSAHQLSLPEGLRWLIHTFSELAELRFRLWGIEPRLLAARPRLSRDVAAAARVLSLELAGDAVPGCPAISGR